MAYVRLPAVIAVPLAAVGAVVWIGQGIAGLTANPKVTVYAEPDSATTVELLDAKQKVVASVELGPGERATLETKRGQHSVRSTRRDGNGPKHEVSIKLGLGEQHAVPTSPDQCFAVLDISAWYGRRHRAADVVDARVVKRLEKSEPYELPDETYGTLRETPTSIENKDKPKLVTAFPCSKIKSAADSDILATLERRLTVSSETLTSIMQAKEASQNEGPVARTGTAAFTRIMGEQKKDWMRVHQDETVLAYRHQSGEFLVVETSAIPPQVEAFVANIENAGPATKGVYRRADLLPSLGVFPGRFDVKVDVGAGADSGREAGVVLRRPGDRTDFRVASAVLNAIGGDMKELALANAKARYAAATAKCVAKIAAKPAVCTIDETDATGILVAIADDPKVKGKVWLRLDEVKGLQVQRAAKKVPTTGFGDEVDGARLFTLKDHALTPGLE